MMATWLDGSIDLDQTSDQLDQEEEVVDSTANFGWLDASTTDGASGSVLQLEGIRHGPSTALGNDEGNWVVIVNGHTLTPESFTGTEHSINFGHELSGSVFIADGMGGYEELHFDNINQIMW